MKSNYNKEPGMLKKILRYLLNLTLALLLIIFLVVSTDFIVSLELFNKEEHATQQDYLTLKSNYNILSLQFITSMDRVREEFARLEGLIETKETPDSTSCDIEQHTTATLIKLICQRRGFDYEIAYAFALSESQLNPEAMNLNDNGTYDYGLYQFNDVFLTNYGLTKEDAFDIITSTEYFILHINNMIEKYGDLYTAFRTYAVGEYGAIERGWGYTYADKIFTILGKEISHEYT